MTLYQPDRDATVIVQVRDVLEATFGMARATGSIQLLDIPVDGDQITRDNAEGEITTYTFVDSLTGLYENEVLIDSSVYDCAVSLTTALVANEPLRETVEVLGAKKTVYNRDAGFDANHDEDSGDADDEVSSSALGVPDTVFLDATRPGEAYNQEILLDATTAANYVIVGMTGGANGTSAEDVEAAIDDASDAIVAAIEADDANSEVQSLVVNVGKDATTKLLDAVTGYVIRVTGWCWGATQGAGSYQFKSAANLMSGAIPIGMNATHSPSRIMVTEDDSEDLNLTTVGSDIDGVLNYRLIAVE